MLGLVLSVLGAMVAGFVIGALVYRNNTKKLEEIIEMWDLEKLSEVRKNLREKKKDE